MVFYRQYSDLTIHMYLESILQNIVISRTKIETVRIFPKNGFLRRLRQPINVLNKCARVFSVRVANKKTKQFRVVNLLYHTY